MQCWTPQFIWRLKHPDANGKRPLIWQLKQANGRDVVEHVQACGQCTMCRLEKSRIKAIRCVHEAQMHDANCFLTLTYNAENLPSNLSISTDTMQKFWKRFRKAIGPCKIKYYASGEYGDEYSRPHYHACVFGYDFPDKVYHKLSPSGEKLFTSATLDKIWGKGYAYIGEVTFESAAYVARYTMKKVTGKNAEEYYSMYGIEPERSWSSQGLSRSWYEKYKSGVWSYDRVVIRGVEVKPPPYYDKLLEKENPFLYTEIKEKRESQINPIDMEDYLSYGRYEAKSLTHNARLDITKFDKQRSKINV